MPDHNFTVEDHQRTICFRLTPDEARAAFVWLTDARKVQNAALKDLSPDAPMIVKELVGAFSAIAESRPYGGR